MLYHIKVCGQFRRHSRILGHMKLTTICQIEKDSNENQACTCSDWVRTHKGCGLNIVKTQRNSTQLKATQKQLR